VLWKYSNCTQIRKYVSADDGVIVALAAVVVVVVVLVTEMQHAAMSAVVFLSQMVTAQSAFAFRFGTVVLCTLYTFRLLRYDSQMFDHYCDNPN
jgi:hypothetical protein